mmetsp:Transcript_988/g.1894  ORF Transcript_988/g.1894 Transcript_988/m.1894 type:complete len:343 (-) Transcript_988:596-1624(-)
MSQADANKCKRTRPEKMSLRNFPTLQKNRALLVLLHYSEKTGKKWAAICSEIMRLVGRSATPEAPLLTRQDLEAWASGRSQLGDQKFALVFEFLVHPETLKRAEFSNANSILVEERLSTYADVLNGLVGGEALRPVHIDKKISNASFGLVPQDCDGLFVLRRGSTYSLLYLSFEEKLNAYLSHMFVGVGRNPEDWIGEVDNAHSGAQYMKESGRSFETFDPKAFLATIDWSICRYSGLGVFGNPIQIFLRGIENKETKSFNIHASIERSNYAFSQREYPRFWLVDQNFSGKIAEQIAKSDEAHNGYLDFSLVDISDHVCGMRTRYISEIEDVFDDIKWNVGL